MKSLRSKINGITRRAFGLAALSAVALVPLTTTASLAQEKINWKVQATFNTGWPGLGNPIANVSDMLKRATDGRINLKVFEPGKIVPPLEISPSISSGSLPAAYNYMAYDQGRIPSAVLFSAVPFGLEPQEYIAWWFEGGGHQLAEEVYHAEKIHPLLCSTIGPETAGWFRKPISTLDDMKGLKIRFSGLGGQVLNKIGASATLMAGGEIFAALEKGTLDATEYSMPAIDNILGFYKIAKYNLFPGWHQPSTSTHLMINLDNWNALADSDKALFEMACTAATARAFAEGEALQGAQIKDFESKGVTAAKLPDEVIAKLQATAKEVMAEESAKDAMFAKIWESQQAFHADYQTWKELGYFPRDFK